MLKPQMTEILQLYSIKYNNKNILCPFHADKRPSFSVKETYFICFACGAKGDSIDFVMLSEGCDFKTALQKLKISDFTEIKKINTQKKIEEEKKERYYLEYLSLLRDFDKYTLILSEYSPKRNTYISKYHKKIFFECWKEYVSEAINKISYIEYKLEYYLMKSEGLL